jgi:lipopolysaccharide biosynthesis glycosyltransferase
LDDLYNTDLGKYPVGAVYDNYVRLQPGIGIIEENNYFNSGVLLLNLSVWREQKITEKTIDFLNQNPQKIKYVDQDGLNAVLKNNWMHIDKKFNLIYSYIPEALSLKDLEEFLDDKVILHFTLNRPWNMLCGNRCRYLYFKYLKHSGVKVKKRYTDFEYGKIPKWLKIRLLEFYNDHELFKLTWRKIKKILILK